MKKKKVAKSGQRPPAQRAGAIALPALQRQLETHYQLAEAHRQHGELAQAVSHYRAALAIAPAFYAGHVNLSVALLALGRHAEAASALRAALAIDPLASEAHINLGLCAMQAGQLDAAIASLRHALTLAPGSLFAHYNLGMALCEHGQPAEAVASYRNALALDPDHADTHNNCGLAYWAQGAQDQAIACYLEAIRCNPACAPAYTNLGNVLQRQGKMAIALDAFSQAIAADPGYAMAYLNQGGALRDVGRFDEAMASYRRALALQPGWLEAQAGLLFLMSSLGAGDAPDYQAELARFGDMLERHVAGRGLTAWQPRADGVRLKVGMVSGDLRAHPVAYFLEGVLGHLPGLGIDVTLYPTTSLQDAMSARLRSLGAAWHPLVGLGDDAAARRIHADGIDVLIDLAGHTNDNRLAVFGWRPAPVQLSWLGYFASTGVRQMDAILVDPVGVPPGAAGQFTEQACYLPDTRLCFSAPAAAPAPAPLPALRKGQVTFGCFQHHPKVSDAQLALWTRVLDAVPGAVLRWQCKQFADPQCVEQTAARLVACGIGLERAQLFGQASHPDYLAAHAEVDIILDTSPYPGGTTTCEALWMGVPTVTLAGHTLLSRQGASLLSAAGLADWVADNEQDYVARAVAAAQDLPALAALRAGLRQQVASSPLCHGYRFAVHFHAALLGLWNQRQASQR